MRWNLVFVFGSSLRSREAGDSFREQRLRTFLSLKSRQVFRNEGRMNLATLAIPLTSLFDLTNLGATAAT